MTKGSFKEESFHQQIGLIFKKETGEVLYIEYRFYGAKS
jgi:hypothetical protein